MKKVFLIMCLMAFTAPVFAEGSTHLEAVKYMNQSQGFSGFNRSLPKTENLEKFEQPTEVKKSGEKQYDYYGYEIEEKSDEVPVKKVIKTRDTSKGTVSQNTDKSAPMTYDNFPKFYDNNNMMQNSMQGIMPGMMPGLGTGMY